MSLTAIHLAAIVEECDMQNNGKLSQAYSGAVKAKYKEFFHSDCPFTYATVRNNSNNRLIGHLGSRHSVPFIRLPINRISRLSVSRLSCFHCIHFISYYILFLDTGV